MEEGGGRRWDEMIPDALGLIFRHLSLTEMLTTVPRVCKSWNRAVLGPYCWQEIDIKEWSYLSSGKPELIDRMLRTLLARSGGSLRRLCVSGLPADDSLFEYIVHHASALESLEIPMGEMNDSMIKLAAPRLSNITFLDVSNCTKISAHALQALGKHCISLVGLRRTMHPSFLEDNITRDDEANAIASTMPKLRHLEIPYLLLTTGAVLEILSCCMDLNFLDIRGCWDVKLDDKFLLEKYPTLKVLGPNVVDCYERNFWEDQISDYSDNSDYSWVFMDDYMYPTSDDDVIWEDSREMEEFWRRSP